jgi:L-amino acid N-acyltransferase YncA
MPDAVIANPSDMADVWRFSAGSPMTRHLIEPQFGPLRDWLDRFHSSDSFKAFSVTRHDDGRLAGWSCCVRFHQRAGYAETALFFIDMEDALYADGRASALLASCERQMKGKGITKLVAFAPGDMPALQGWLENQRFSPCGSLPLEGQERLAAFVKRG